MPESEPIKKKALGSHIGHAAIDRAEHLTPAAFDPHAEDGDGDLLAQEGTTAVHAVVPTPDIGKWGRIGADPSKGFFTVDDKRHQKVLDLISTIHGIHPAKPYQAKRDRSTGRERATRRPLFTTIRSGSGKHGGGLFYPKGEERRIGTGRIEFIEEPTIVVSFRKKRDGYTNSGRPKMVKIPNSDIPTLAHEIGHRLDWVYDDNVPDNPNPTSITGTGFASLGTLKTFTRRDGTEITRGSQAMTDLMDAAVNNEHFGKIMDTVKDWPGVDGKTAVDYYSDATEVWARAYEQWMTQKLDSEFPGAYHSLMTSPVAPAYWPTEYFNERIAPKLEDVLRERGLMR